MSLIQIYTYRSDGGRQIILGQKKDSGGGGLKESLASELKNIGHMSFFYCIVNWCMQAQYKELQQSVEQVYGAGGLG